MADDGRHYEAGASGEQARSFSLLPLLEAAGLVLLAVLLLWKGILPAWRTLNTDFPNYYLAARLLHEGWNLDRIYDWIWLQRIKDHWGLSQPLVGFAGLTPFSALPVLPFSGFPALEAKRFWIVINIGFLFGTVELLARVTQLGRRRIWILSLLAILPLRTSFLFGQMHIVILLLVALAYFFHRRRQSVLCGVCLSIAGALKVYPLLFALYFLWKRQWRALLAVTCSALVLLGVSYVFIGSHVTSIYLSEILPRSMQGEVLDPYNVRAASGAALFHRLFLFEPGLNPAPVFRSPALYALLYPLWQVAILAPLFAGLRIYADRDESEPVEWAAFLFALLLLSPVPSSYHFVAMIFSIVLLADVLIPRRQYGYLAVAVGLYFLISIAGLIPLRDTVHFSPWTLLAFTRLWVAMLLWLSFVFYLWRENHPVDVFNKQSRYALAFGVFFAAMWLAGWIGNHRHLAGLNQDLRARLPLPGSALLATGVHADGDGFWHTSMVPAGYRILDEQGNRVWTKEPQADQLSSAIAANHSMKLIEIADANGSRVIDASSALNSSTLQFPDAETPTLSADGSEVAYLRGDHEKSSLWMARLRHQDGQALLASEPQLLAASYDVGDVTFTPSGSIVFSSRVHGRSSIFKMTPGDTPAAFISEDEDVDSPAFSPDERYVVFRKLLRHRWQLVLLNMASRQERPLTFGDCNAYQPAWMDQSTIAYASDCGRGLGLTALAAIHIDR